VVLVLTTHHARHPPEGGFARLNAGLPEDLTIRGRFWAHAAHFYSSVFIHVRWWLKQVPSSYFFFFLLMHTQRRTQSSELSILYVPEVHSVWCNARPFQVHRPPWAIACSLPDARCQVPDATKLPQADTN
jgi:hypothetical protein